MGDRFNYMELPEPDFSARANSTTVEHGDDNILALSHDRSVRPFDDVLRRGQGGLDPAPPGMLRVAAGGRQLKIQRFPVGIEQQVELQPAFAQVDGVSQAVRVIAPIRVV